MSTPTEIINEPTVFVSGANRVMFYSDFVDNLFKTDTKDMEYMHAALGVAGEAGELADAVKKHVVYGKELDRNNIVEELGDLRFYMQQLMNMVGISEEEVLQGNATKLGKRYKNGSFSQQEAIARADKVVAIVVTTGNWGLTPDQQIKESFNPHNYDDWERTEPHIWFSTKACGFVFVDDAEQFDTTLYKSADEARTALRLYIKHHLG